MVEATGKRRLAVTSWSLALEAHAPLLDAIAADPDEVAPWTVYADLLQTEGHPRGELISVMLERERQPSLRLYEAQRKQFSVLGATHDFAIGWRRGFVSEVRLEDPEQLAEAASDLSLRFVDAATLVIEDWSAWREVLSETRMPWRRLRVEARCESLEVAQLFACAPSLETLRIEFPDGGELVWDYVRAASLELLVLVNAGEIDTLDDAELPLLEELRLLGDTTASEALWSSVCWNRLQRVVLPPESEVGDAESGPTVRVMAADARRLGDAEDDDDDDDDWEAREQQTSTAFVVVGQPIEAALLSKLALRISIAHLSVRICLVRWPRLMTVLQFFGAADAELLPYGFALALKNVLDTPVALVEVDEDRAARYLVLADTETRANDVHPADVVRKALDLTVGEDLGSGVMQDVLEQLAATPIEVLVGNGGTDQLTMVDPSTAPLVVAEDPEQYEDEEDEDEDDNWHYYEDVDDSYDETVVTAEDVAVAAIVAEQVADANADLEQEIEIEQTILAELVPELEDALALPPERTDLWVEFHDLWDERALAVDDEPSEARWPDPESAEERRSELDRQVAEPACAQHVLALEHCTWCGALYCAECGPEDRCASCIDVFVIKTPNGSTATREPLSS